MRCGNSAILAENGINSPTAARNSGRFSIDDALESAGVKPPRKLLNY
jgi:hypothetical protein